ncbi:MAG: hypothetical protein ABSA75_10610 [Candidatus Bathyarchaeia archaeon]|jgi:hypothetical protein
MARHINWFGLAAGIIILVVLVISFYIPWWQLTIGENLIKVNVSPVNTNFGLFGTQFTIPLIWALNLVSILTLTASGLVMLFYSFMPTKSYSKQLLGFSYKKPLYLLVTFVAGLLVAILVAGLLGISIPFAGSTTLALPTKFTSGAEISALVSGSFQLPFWLAIAAAALCITARLYHARITKLQKTAPVTVLNETATINVKV